MHHRAMSAAQAAKEFAPACPPTINDAHLAIGKGQATSKASCLLARSHHVAADPEAAMRKHGLRAIMSLSDGELLGETKGRSLNAKRIFKTIKVRDSDKVKADQMLIELDTTSTKADNIRVRQKRASALFEVWRTQALPAALDKKDTAKTPTLSAQASLSNSGLYGTELVIAPTQLNAEWQGIQAQHLKLQSKIDARTGEL